MLWPTTWTAWPFSNANVAASVATGTAVGTTTTLFICFQYVFWSVLYFKRTLSLLIRSQSLPYYRSGAIWSKKSVLFLSALIGANSCCVWISASVQLIESMTDKKAIISANEKKRFFWSYGASAIIKCCDLPSRFDWLIILSVIVFINSVTFQRLRLFSKFNCFVSHETSWSQYFISGSRVLYK